MGYNLQQSTDESYENSTHAQRDAMERDWQVSYDHMGLKSEDQVKLAEAVNLLCQSAYGASSKAGWWKGKDEGELDADSTCTKLLLIVSEVTEAMEGLRKGLMDDKLPHRKMFDVELADALIRIGDLAGRFGINLGDIVVEKMRYNAGRADHKLENRNSEGGKKF